MRQSFGKTFIINRLETFFNYMQTRGDIEADGKEKKRRHVDNRLKLELACHNKPKTCDFFASFLVKLFFLHQPTPHVVCVGILMCVSLSLLSKKSF